MALTQPSFIPQPWGSNGQVGNIPQDSSEFGKASWAKGFPTETAQPLSEGGIPPKYLDFQAVLNSLSEHNFFQQSGAKYTWSANLQYPTKAVILGSDGNVYEAVRASGPGSSVGAVNPVTDENRNAWQPYTALPEQSAAEQGFVLSTNGSEAEWYDIKSDTVDAVEQASEGFNGEAGDSPTTAQLATELLTKANTDLGNLSIAGLNVAAGASMPSDRTITQTWGSTWTTYTAPTNGWFYAGGSSSEVGAFITLYGQIAIGITAPSVGFALRTFIPIQKGSTVTLAYQGVSEPFLYFVFAQGAE